MADDILMDRERTLFELGEAWRLASTRGTNLERLIFGLGYVLVRCPEDMTDLVRAAILNAERRLYYAVLAGEEKPS